MTTSQSRKLLRLSACPHICPHKPVKEAVNAQDPLRWCFIWGLMGGSLSRHTDSEALHPFCTDLCRAIRKDEKGRDPTDTEVKTWLPWLSGLGFRHEDYKRFGQQFPHFEPYIFIQAPRVKPPPVSWFTDGRTGIPTDASWEDHYDRAILLPNNPPPPPQLPLASSVANSVSEPKSEPSASVSASESSPARSLVGQKRSIEEGAQSSIKKVKLVYSRAGNTSSSSSASSSSSSSSSSRSSQSLSHDPNSSTGQPSSTPPKHNSTPRSDTNDHETSGLTAPPNLNDTPESLMLALMSHYTRLEQDFKAERALRIKVQSELEELRQKTIDLDRVKQEAESLQRELQELTTSWEKDKLDFEGKLKEARERFKAECKTQEEKWKQVLVDLKLRVLKAVNGSEF